MKVDQAADEVLGSSVGCKMVPNNEWYQAPLDVPIYGLKELEESE